METADQFQGYSHRFGILGLRLGKLAPGMRPAAHPDNPEVFVCVRSLSLVAAGLLHAFKVGHQTGQFAMAAREPSSRRRRPLSTG